MEKKNSLLFDLLEIIVGALVITFIVLKFVLISVQVEGTSMYPTLHESDRGFSFIITRNFGIKRFDVVVIDTDKNKNLLVKRVIGLPFEKIDYIDNKLYINDEYIEESFLSDVYTEDFSYELKEDEYFCLGDNRVVSRDSRYYGPFKKAEIVSTHVLVLYPFENAGFN